MASYGTLITRVYTSNAQIPLAGVRVSMTQKQFTDGRYILLASRISDESGRTAPVRVETPAPPAGQSPGNSIPFSLVDLLAQAPGFELLQVEDIQLFPEQVTIQNLELVPLPEYVSPGTASEAVIIPPQSL